MAITWSIRWSTILQRICSLTIDIENKGKSIEAYNTFICCTFSFFLSYICQSFLYSLGTCHDLTRCELIFWEYYFQFHFTAWNCVSSWCSLRLLFSKSGKWERCLINLYKESQTSVCSTLISKKYHSFCMQ